MVKRMFISFKKEAVFIERGYRTDIYGVFYITFYRFCSMSQLFAVKYSYKIEANTTLTQI